MSARRPPADPPRIAGYDYVRLLGSGGFSDVYLYRQDRPRRQVAVKVLLAGPRTDSARTSFESEANLMAQLSSHPYIVTIFEADVTAAGHSYLAMEYCSRPSLEARYKSAPLGVDEVLAIGIQVASAVETAHRAGIVHRDIKPANILVTDYNRPALTDFGISGTTDEPDEDTGLSIPWSPPEAFGAESPSGVRMDVWSLGATLYTLLAGHSPFVRRGGENTQRELIGRISSSELPSLNRPDVPASLERTLATALAKDPALRFASAHQLALSLQRIQGELGLSVTDFEVLEDPAGPAAPEPEEGQATRVRRVTSIDPEARVSAATSRAAPGTPPAVSPVRPSPFAPPPASDGSEAGDATLMRPRRAERPDPGLVQPLSPAPVTAAVHRSPVRLLLVAGATIAAIVAGAIVVGNIVGSAAMEPQPDGQPLLTQPPADPLLGAGIPVPKVTGFSASRAEGSVDFSWKNPDPQPGDSYFWAPVSATETGADKAVKKTEAGTAPRRGEPTCIQVTLVRSSGRASEPARYCAKD
ncbi:serine/threonine-protein kinase [Paeniglutamicibacter cryotolerans]|uniref:non-specific serine/threonine protein kinase n=1 Tax=Paeniglutamicibacter cryotolerans TaxID=670079 RepID=A0A839QIM3_9MICC|nr:serine/threonine-protein kinase [Paeniglutamicibacter cryotolerans]MBB2996039.1 serine/threonine protein kinase [Paeniglutamicibacter cryotolerans]